MGSYGNDRQWSDRFIPEIRRIVGPYLLSEAPDLIDRREAADLIVLRANGLTIACRVRRPGFENFGNQFTIRSHRDSGAKTELAKIVDGFGDWMFYAHASRDNQTFLRWMLIDLSAFRAQLIRNRNRLKSGNQPNWDGTEFAWFDVTSFAPDPPILIAQSGIIVMEESRQPEPEVLTNCGPAPQSLFAD